ncbi:MAG: RNA polymerase subunit sigma-70, partial [Lachnospiraceae bacterium]|nr:RNA polymerase subunit sigma-70 [Lachnospiraceae bacterium]
MEDEKIVDLYWARKEEAISCTDEKYGHYLFK